MRETDATGFVFRNIRVFDPLTTMRRAVVAVMVSVSLMWWLGPWAGFPALFGSVLYMWVLSRSDAAKLTCVSLQINDPVLRSLNVSESGILAEVEFSDASVARVDRSLRRRMQLPAKPGVRVLPIVQATGTSTAAWFDQGILTRLSLEEVRGALSVVLGGEDLRLEILVGSTPVRPPRPVAVCISSTEGSLHSWDDAISPQMGLAATSHVPDFPPPVQERPSRSE